MEKYGVEENNRGGYKGRGDEPLWITKEVDYHQVNEGDMRENKLVGEQSWSRLASLLKAFLTENEKFEGRMENQSAVCGVVHARMDE